MLTDCKSFPKDPARHYHNGSKKATSFFDMLAKDTAMYYRNRRQKRFYNLSIISGTVSTELQRNQKLTKSITILQNWRGNIQ